MAKKLTIDDVREEQANQWKCIHELSQRLSKLEKPMPSSLTLRKYAADGGPYCYAVPQNCPQGFAYGRVVGECPIDCPVRLDSCPPEPKACEHDWQLDYLCGPTGSAAFSCRKCSAMYTRLASGITDNDRRLIANCDHKWGYWDGYGPNRCKKCGAPGSVAVVQRGSCRDCEHCRPSEQHPAMLFCDVGFCHLAVPVVIQADGCKRFIAQRRGTDAEADTTASSS